MFTAFAWRRLLVTRLMTVQVSSGLSGTDITSDSLLEDGAEGYMEKDEEEVGETIDRVYRELLTTTEANRQLAGFLSWHNEMAGSGPDFGGKDGLRGKGGRLMRPKSPSRNKHKRTPRGAGKR